ncbi:MurR/RpiR family transcriptional regulator [Pararhizobium mangrovi]|uniref:MurR/RpiR family transcriptional regulator n=1 Tax=Pararhizobium mangrovi TaxID=2590452 RepID=UPI001AEDF19E|nr:MurR/RpiR family transcriptional regulator [Pararhizobium mangrovi]
MPKSSVTVRELIRTNYTSLTPSERKFAQALLDNYPSAGLTSITAAARNANVSVPTVARMINKLGFTGYPPFHHALLQELEAKALGPTERRAKWASEAPETHQLNRFTETVMRNLEQTFANIDSAQFDAAVKAMAETSSHLYVVGGRITQSLATYAFTHFQAVREHTTHMTSVSATWPHYVLDMQKGDVLLVFDIRRYDAGLMRLAEQATREGVQVVLITDQWTSPVADWADYTFNCWVEIPSAWDSNVATMLLLEAMIAAIQEENWPRARARYDRLEDLFDRMNLFRRS